MINFYFPIWQIPDLAILPQDFLLEGEKFISKEGCLLFLAMRMSVVDCRHLCVYKREIERLQLELRGQEMNSKQVSVKVAK